MGGMMEMKELALNGKPYRRITGLIDTRDFCVDFLSWDTLSMGIQ
jgi:hypothetical protein